MCYLFFFGLPLNFLLFMYIYLPFGAKHVHSQLGVIILLAAFGCTTPCASWNRIHADNLPQHLFFARYLVQVSSKLLGMGISCPWLRHVTFCILGNSSLIKNK
jgi:hypothetical protein